MILEYSITCESLMALFSEAAYYKIDCHFGEDSF